jgi:hypothetical protein
MNIETENNIRIEWKHLKPVKGIVDYIDKTIDYSLEKDGIPVRGYLNGIALMIYNTGILVASLKGLEALFK